MTEECYAIVSEDGKQYSNFMFDCFQEKFNYRCLAPKWRCESMFKYNCMIHQRIVKVNVQYEIKI